MSPIGLTQQVRVLESFLALHTIRSTWNGALLLGLGLSDAGRALAMASLAAGAAGLFLEADLAKLRLAQREGCCTFTVSMLEEAVRALKNEVRQGRGITLALSGNPDAHLTEIVDRGLQPQVIALVGGVGPAEAEPVTVLRQRGAQVLNASESTATACGRVIVDGLDQTTGKSLEIRTDRAATMAERRNRDRDLLAALGNMAELTTTVSAKWLRSAPSLFPRALERAYLYDPGSI